MMLKKGRLLVFMTLLLLFTCNLSVYAASVDNDTVSNMFDKNEQPEDRVGNDPTPAPVDDSPSFASLLIRTVIILLLIIVLMYALSRWITKRGKIFETNQFIKVKSAVNLGQNKSLRLVKVGNSYYLLGVGNDITLLKEFTTEDEINEIEMLQPSTDENRVASAAQVWSNLRSLFSKKAAQQSPNFQSQLEEKLTDLRGKTLPLNTTGNDDRQQNRGEFTQ